MNDRATANSGMAILPMKEQPGQDAPATSRETVGCELAAEVVRSFGSLRLRAVGGSMLPTVWPGDLLHVRGYDATKALPGDIVVFKRDGRLVTHRVVEVRSQESGVRSREQPPMTRHPTPLLTFVTRGDRVRHNDAPISRHEILGRVSAIERGSRRFSPRQSAAGRLASWILCRSDLATRVVLGLRCWRLGISA